MINQELRAALYDAIMAQSKEDVQRVVETKGLSCETLDRLLLPFGGSTPLTLATTSGTLEIVQVLLDAGSDPLIRRGGDSPIHIAAQVKDRRHASVCCLYDNNKGFRMASISLFCLFPGWRRMIYLTLRTRRRDSMDSMAGLQGHKDDCAANAFLAAAAVSAKARTYSSFASFLSVSPALSSKFVIRDTVRQIRCHCHAVVLL